MNGFGVPDLALASTALLGVGAVAGLVARAPVHRQRVAELAVLATVIWLALAVVPLPRVRGDVAAPAAGIAALPVASEPIEGAIAAPVTPLQAAEPTTRRVPLTTVVGAVWAAGAMVVAAYVLVGVLLVVRLLARAKAPPAWLEDLFTARCGVLGVRRARLLVSPARGRPLCVGVLRPTVVLPKAMIDGRRAGELRRILDHELTHVLRGDARGRLLFALAAPLLWLHPLFWWLRARAALAAELIADDAAGAGDRHAYARGLLALAEELGPAPPAPLLTTGTFRTRSELERRIDMLANGMGNLALMCTPARRVGYAAALVLAVGACAALFGVQSEAAASPTAPVLDAVVVQPPAAQEPEPVVAEEPIVEAAPAVARAPQAAPMVAAAAPQEDPDLTKVLELVERAHALLTDMELVQAQVAVLERQVQTGAADELVLVRARAEARGIERRLQVVRLLVDAEMKATQLEMTQVQRAMQRNEIEETQGQILLTRLNARLDVLKTVS